MKKTTYIIIGAIILIWVGSLVTVAALGDKDAKKPVYKIESLTLSGKEAEIRPGDFSSVRFSFADCTSEELRAQIVVTDSVTEPVIIMDSAWVANTSVSLDDDSLLRIEINNRANREAEASQNDGMIFSYKISLDHGASQLTRILLPPSASLGSLDCNLVNVSVTGLTSPSLDVSFAASMPSFVNCRIDDLHGNFTGNRY